MARGAERDQIIRAIILADTIGFNVMHVMPFLFLGNATPLASVIISLANAFRQIIPAWAAIIWRFLFLPEWMIRSSDVLGEASPSAKVPLRFSIMLFAVGLTALFTGVRLPLARLYKAFFAAIQHTSFCRLEGVTAFKTREWR